jgi:hypothetical protein
MKNIDNNFFSHNSKKKLKQEGEGGKWRGRVKGGRTLPCVTTFGEIIATLFEVVVSSALKRKGVATMLSIVDEVINVAKSSHQRQSN